MMCIVLGCVSRMSSSAIYPKQLRTFCLIIMLCSSLSNIIVQECELGLPSEKGGGVAYVHLSDLRAHRQTADALSAAVTHQASVAKRIIFGLQSVTGQPNVTLARRPFFIFWFMSQIARWVILLSASRNVSSTSISGH